MSPYHKIPIELEKDVVVLDFPLPQSSELEAVLEKALQQSRQKKTSSPSQRKIAPCSPWLNHR